MKSRRKFRTKKAADYAGGGSDFPQHAKDLASPERGMTDGDMGRYGAVREKRNPLTVDQDFKHVSGGGASGSYHGKKTSRSWPFHEFKTRRFAVAKWGQRASWQGGITCRKEIAPLQYVEANP
jgi:hypothetical protein